MSQPRKAPLPFDGETFKTLLHDTVDRLLAHQTELPDQPALITAVPAPMQEFLAGELNTQPAEDPAALIDTLCDGLLHYRCRTTHPRFFGLITGSASPLSWLGEIITSGVNAHPGSQFLGVGACDIERRMVKWCCDLIGYDDDAGGVFVSGGSTANMTGLVAARHAKLTPATHTKGVVYYSEQTHSSVAKALRISGIYEHQQRVLPCDENYCLDLDALRNALQKDIDAGLVPYAVIGNAGAINTGSIDDLDAIADLCEQHNMWFHADGAFGASIILSPRQRWRQKGLHRADSVSWDAHKWLFQTYGCSMVLVKRKQDLVDTFSNQPEYLTAASNADPSRDNWNIGPELSRPARATKLWLTLNLLGSERMAEQIDWAYQLVEWAAEALHAQDPNWHIVTPPQQGVINFRYAPPGLDEAAQDRLNDEISTAMLEEGYAAVLTTKLSGRTVLRICALSPATTQHDIDSTIEHLTHFAQTLQPPHP